MSSVSKNIALVLCERDSVFGREPEATLSDSLAGTVFNPM